jgi:hypothetical protein
MHLPFIIGLAVVLVALPFGRKQKQKLKDKVEQRKESKQNR